MTEIIHPFYQQHRDAMEGAMRRRLDLAEPMLRARTDLADIDVIRREVMDELDIVLTQMPYVGGATSRMSDVFVRLTGFMATSRVLRRYGVPLPDIRSRTWSVPRTRTSPGRGLQSAVLLLAVICCCTRGRASRRCSTGPVTSGSRTARRNRSA